MFDVSNRHDPVDGGDTTLWLTALWTGHCADCDYEIWVCDVGCAETFRSFPEAMRNNNRDCAPPHWRLAAHGRGVAGEPAKQARRYELREPLEVPPGAQRGVYVYGNHASAICFDTLPAGQRGNAAENGDLAVEAGSAMNATRWSSQGNHGLYEL